jgi:hypothetical protein
MLTELMTADLDAINRLYGYQAVQVSQEEHGTDAHNH